MCTWYMWVLSMFWILCRSNLPFNAFQPETCGAVASFILTMHDSSKYKGLAKLNTISIDISKTEPFFGHPY